MKRYCLALDLREDAALIAEYERSHARVPEPVKKSIRDAGITDMQIFRSGNRLFMIMETLDDFSFAVKQAMDEANPAVRDWEARMGALQQALPWARPGEKWVLMDRIFKL